MTDVDPRALGSTRLLNSIRISGKLVSVKVGGNFTVVAATAHPIYSGRASGIRARSAIPARNFAPRLSSLSSYLSSVTAVRAERENLASAKRAFVQPVHAYINIWIFMKRLSERAATADGLSISFFRIAFRFDFDITRYPGRDRRHHRRRRFRRFVQRFSIYLRRRCLL